MIARKLGVTRCRLTRVTEQSHARDEVPEVEFHRTLVDGRNRDHRVSAVRVLAMSRPERTCRALVAVAVLAATSLTFTLEGRASAVAQPDASQASVSRALVDAGRLKVAVAEFFVDHNRMPASLQDVGELTLSREGSTASIGFGGVIAVIVPAPSSGKEQRLFLVPAVGGHGLSWSCVTPDIVDVTSLAPNCRYVAGFDPRAAPASAFQASPSLQGNVARIERERRLGVDPNYFHRANIASLPVSGFDKLSEAERTTYLAEVASTTTGHLETLTITRSYSDWLVTGGRAVMKLLEHQVANGPADVAAPALLALCELKQTPNKTSTWKVLWTDDFGACLRSPRAGSTPAIERLAALARADLEKPPLVRGYLGSLGAQDVVFCVDAAGLATALGADARGSVAALAALLEDPRPHRSGNVDTCPRRLVSEALVKILLSSPRDIAKTALAESATVILVESTLIYGESTRSAPSPELGRLLDAGPISATLRRQLDAAAASWTKQCEAVSDSAVAFAADLGRPGFYFVGALLDRVAEQPAKCASDESRRQLLELFAAYGAVHQDGPCRGLSADWAAAPLMVSPSEGDGHAHFLFRQANAWEKRRAYLALGDVVFVRNEDAERVHRARTGGNDPGKICAWYQNGGPKTSGWVSMADLDDMPTDAQWAEIAPKMPAPAGWPTSAWRMNYYPKEWFDQSVIPQGHECAPSVIGEACARLQRSRRYARYREGSYDCGSYSVFLFNNGVSVVAEGTGCYGEHGQNDPTGFYLNVNEKPNPKDRCYRTPDTPWQAGVGSNERCDEGEPESRTGR